MAARCSAAVLFLCASATHGQNVLGARAGTVNFTEGQVSVVSAQPVALTPHHYPSLTDGQMLRTGRGRAEVFLGSGVCLWLDRQGELKMLDSRLEDTQVELQKGTALVEVVEVPKGSRLQIKLGEASVTFKSMGLYRFAVEAHGLRVFGGTAEATLGNRKVEGGRGRLLHLDSALSLASFNTKSTGTFHQWAGQRSFLLYVMSLEAGGQPINWELTALGWSWNRDFGMRLYSPLTLGRRRSQASAR